MGTRRRVASLWNDLDWLKSARHNLSVPHTLTAYRVFVASPGGLVPERQAFRDAINAYNEMDAISRGVMFIPVGWEQTLPGMGRPQSLINEDLRDCDYFVLILWDRWGSSSGDAAYTSATSEEYAIARECWNNSEHCLREIAAFFKAAEPRQMSDPGEQLRNVLDFKRQLEQTKELLFSTFDDVSLFQRQLQRLLAKWVRDHEQGRRSPASKQVPRMPSPEASATGLSPTASVTAGLRHLDKSRAVLEEAQGLVRQGKLTDAEMLFARALAKDNEPGTALQYSRFLRSLGRFSQAQALLEGILQRTAPGEEHWKAGAYNYLGMLCRDQGQLNEAEKMLNQAKSLADQPGTRETTIAAYNNLGQVYRDRGDLAEAERMHQRGIDLCKPSGDEASLASSCGNLAHIYLIRDELARCEAMNGKAIELSEKIGNQEGLTIALRNQGLLLMKQKHLGEAEEILRRSLEIASKIGRQKSMADAYSSLAQLKAAQNEIAEAEQLIAKSIEVNERIGRRKGVARSFGLLGEFQQAKGDAAQAEQSLLRAIEVARMIGDKICVANAYRALGTIFKSRGEGSAASLLWRDARQIFQDIGMTEKLRELNNLLATPQMVAGAS
jgi:tetratricopeptide (TPR) repeat protein